MSTSAETHATDSATVSALRAELYDLYSLAIDDGIYLDTLITPVKQRLAAAEAAEAAEAAREGGEP
jgi:hypothetical protein